MPTNAAGVSAEPKATGVPGGNPSSLATAASRSPATAPDAPIGGSSREGRPRASITGPAQDERAKSNSSVAEASLGSLPALPMSLKRNQSLG